MFVSAKKSFAFAVALLAFSGTALAQEAAKFMPTSGFTSPPVGFVQFCRQHLADCTATYSSRPVVGLTRQMSIELAPHGIRVLAIAPGVCLTEKTMFMAQADPEMLRQTGIPGIAGSRFGRHGVADDVARVALFCASDLSLFMSGSTLVVDGGIAA